MRFPEKRQEMKAVKINTAISVVHRSRLRAGDVPGPLFDPHIALLPDAPSHGLDMHSYVEIDIDPSAVVISTAWEGQRYQLVVLYDAKFKILIAGRG
jgi:hypothetical protein